MGICPRCRHVNPDYARVCYRCVGDLLSRSADNLSTTLPARMVEPIDTPQKPPPDSKLIPNRLIQSVSLNENADSKFLEAVGSPPEFEAFPTMASEESPGYVVETIHNSFEVAVVALVQSQDRIAAGGTLQNRPGSSERTMNEADIESPAPVTAPNTSSGDQSATPVPATVPPKLVVLRGLKIGVEYPIYEGKNIIGRFADKPVDIDLLNQESVEQIWCSRQHAVVTFSKGMIIIEDLNSLNKTWVNGNCVHPGQQRQLKPGDIVQIGTVQMKLAVG
jgi:pSer/pThr/pTyr-binding forkhead associated (FHA) protein